MQSLRISEDGEWGIAVAETGDHWDETYKALKNSGFAGIIIHDLTSTTPERLKKIQAEAQAKGYSVVPNMINIIYPKQQQ